MPQHGRFSHRVQMPFVKAELTQWSKDMDEVMSSLDAIKETMLSMLRLM